MTKQLNIRNVPTKFAEWVESQRTQQGMNKNEFLLSTLMHSWTDGDTMSLPFPRANGVQRRDSDLPFNFVDLFAGIGGLRIGLERNGGNCVFSSEWDPFSQKTYKRWFGELPHGDITKIPPASIPDHDILAAGFPCQPFSLAGVSKKNSLGRLHGFKCNTQGTLFFNIASIIEVKRPPVVLLENVKNIKSHDQGRTWAVITQTLSELNYAVFSQVIDAAGWVPQHRERVYIVCFDKYVFGESPAFSFPEKVQGRMRLSDILDPAPEARYTLSDHLWKYLQDYAQRHREKGNGFGFGLADPNGITRTLSARYHKDGSEILIPQPGKNPRRLTPQECQRLMGFPDDKTHPIVVSDTQAYRQFGNAVVPKVSAAVVRSIVPVLRELIRSRGNGCLVKRTEHELAMAGD
jgi:DNA (cytosine-5)-methyltransferase 1